MTNNTLTEKLLLKSQEAFMVDCIINLNKK